MCFLMFLCTDIKIKKIFLKKKKKKTYFKNHSIPILNIHQKHLHFPFSIIILFFFQLFMMFFFHIFTHLAIYFLLLLGARVTREVDF